MKHMKVRLKNIQFVWKIIFLLLLLIATFSYAMFQGGFVSWYLFYAFMPFSLYSLALAFYPLHSFQIRRTFNKGEFSAGDQFVCTIELTRKFAFPLFYLFVEDVLPDRLENSCPGSAKTIMFPWWKRNFSFQYSLDSLPRGNHQLTSVRVRTGDILGFVEREYVYTVEDQFLVYPSYYPFQYKQKESSFEQETGVEHRHYNKNATMAVGVREYEPGDKLSWIDWKATARRNSMMTKEFEKLNSRNVVCIMDRSNSTSFESLVTFAASIVRAVLKSGSKLWFVSIGKATETFPVTRNEDQWNKIFYHLAVTDCDGQDEFLDKLPEEVKQWAKNASVMIITSRITPSFVEKMEQLPKSRHITVWYIREKGKKERDALALIENLRRRWITVHTVYDGKFRNAYEEAESR